MTLSTLGRVDLLGFQLYALCDRGTDLPDCVALVPSDEELAEIEPWLSEQDGNPGWPDQVRATLEDLQRRFGTDGVETKPGAGQSRWRGVDLGDGRHRYGLCGRGDGATADRGDSGLRVGRGHAAARPACALGAMARGPPRAGQRDRLTPLVGSSEEQRVRAFCVSSRSRSRFSAVQPGSTPVPS